MRCFIAIELPDQVRAHLVAMQRTVEMIAPKLALTKAVNLHLTLRFLGEISGRQLESVLESLRRISISEGITLRAEHVELFPERGPLRIVAAGLSGEIERLNGLQKSLEQRAQFLGFEKEDRPFRPHVTIARAKGAVGNDLRGRLMESVAAKLPGPLFIATEFVLMRSHLQNTGSEYEVIARFT